jgi:hypothetical protein
MAVLSLERQWRISNAGDEHIIELHLENKGIHVQFELSIDGTIEIERKEADLAKLWAEYPLQVDGVQLQLRLFKSGILGMATDCELLFQENPIQPEELFILPPISKTDPHEPEGRSADDPSGGQRLYPKLPGSCSSCGAPVHLKNVNWVGPMSAACSSCGTTIEVEWKEI